MPGNFLQSGRAGVGSASPGARSGTAAAPPSRVAVGRGRGGRERGSGQPVPGPPGEAAGYFYPVVFAECAADLPSGARKFPPSASFPFPPFFPPCAAG